jgi:hypothetical protein
MSTKSSGRSRARATPAEVANVDPVIEDSDPIRRDRAVGFNERVKIEGEGGSIQVSIDHDWPAPVYSWGELLANMGWIVAGIIADQQPDLYTRAVVMERLRKAFDSAC